MIIRIIKYSIFLLLLSSDFCSSLSEEAFLYERTVDVLNKTLDFILSDTASFNHDGMSAINMARAHLTKSLENLTDLNRRKDLLLLTEKAETIYTSQLPNLKNFPWKYLVFTNYILPMEVWLHDIEFSYGKLNPNPKVFTGPYNVSSLLGYARYVITSTFDESFSDDCLVEIVTASDDRNPHNCPVSKPCYDYMLKMPESYDSHFPGYGVTHMLLFLQLAKGRNCILNKKEVDALINEECSYILWELRKNVEFGYVPAFFDLFIEQITICGHEGFGEFLEKDYLKYLLQQQNVYGGFGPKILSRKELAKKQRIKRESNRMKYGLDCHTVGLATSTLALFIRSLIKKPFRK